MKSLSVERCGYSILTFAVILFCFSPALFAEENQLIVGLYPESPFVIVNGEEEPEGFSIDVWKTIASELELNYYFLKSSQISGVLEDIVEERIDVGIGAIAINNLREQLVDFSYPYYHTGLGVLVPKNYTWSLGHYLKMIGLKRKFQILGGIFLFIIIVGHMIWLIERTNRSDQSHFDRRYLPGIFEGIYWAIVTASTVGYGDKVAKSWMGKLFVVIVISCALPAFALLTAKLTSNITLHEFDTKITRPSDLINRSIGVLAATTSEEYIQKLGAVYIPFERMETAITYLQLGKIDALVHDRPSLQYHVEKNNLDKLKVLSLTFAPQDYGIALPDDVPLREKINRILLLMIEDGRMRRLNSKWFGG